MIFRWAADTSMFDMDYTWYHQTTYKYMKEMGGWNEDQVGIAWISFFQCFNTYVRIFLYFSCARIFFVIAHPLQKLNSPSLSGFFTVYQLGFHKGGLHATSSPGSSRCHFENREDLGDEAACWPTRTEFRAKKRNAAAPTAPLTAPQKLLRNIVETINNKTTFYYPCLNQAINDESLRSRQVYSGNSKRCIKVRLLVDS